MKEEEVTLFSGNPPMCRRGMIIGTLLIRLKLFKDFFIAEGIGSPNDLVFLPLMNPPFSMMNVNHLIF